MSQPTNTKKPHSGRFGIIFLCTCILSLVLSYVAFGLGTNFQTNQASLGAHAGGAFLALGSNPAGGGGALENPLGPGNNGSLTAFLDKLLGVVIMIGAIVIVFSIILAGLKYVTASGDTKQIEAAHKQLLWTAIGAAILLGARVIMLVIKNTVTTLSS